jgi:hypothetical protein
LFSLPANCKLGRHTTKQAIAVREASCDQILSSQYLSLILLELMSGRWWTQGLRFRITLVQTSILAKSSYKQILSAINYAPEPNHELEENTCDQITVLKAYAWRMGRLAGLVLVLNGGFHDMRKDSTTR